LGWLLGPTFFKPGTAQVVLVMTALLLVLFAVVAQRGIRRFSQPMDNLIDAAGRIEKGDYSAQVPESGPAELTSVARAFNAMSARLKASDVPAAFETQSEAFGVSMASAIASTVPNVDVDPARIRSALANVVSNAIRHTPAGGSIRVDVHPAGENVEVTVTDTGEGISPE